MGLIKIKNIIAGAAAALASSVGIMDCYPLVPAIFAVYLLWNNKTILFYIGLFTGMGYFMSFQTMIADRPAAVCITEIALMYFILPGIISLGGSEFPRSRGFIGKGDMLLDV